MFLKAMGILLIIDGVGSIAWYKEELKGVEGLKIVPTCIRLMRTVIGACLIFV